MDRRTFCYLGSAATLGLCTNMREHPVQTHAAGKIAAVVFDAFTVFNTQHVSHWISSLFPGSSDDFIHTFHQKQFEYCFLRSAAGVYKNFQLVTEDALDFTLEKLQLQVEQKDKHDLLLAYRALNVWPDVLPVLQELKRRNIPMVFLSNMTREMLSSSCDHNRISENFQHFISTDDAKCFKPEPKAYALATQILPYNNQNILFVASASWDASGATWYGYPTMWLNRLALPSERLGVSPKYTGTRMQDILNILS